MILCPHRVSTAPAQVGRMLPWKPMGLSLYLYRLGSGISFIHYMEESKARLNYLGTSWWTLQ